MPILIAKFLQFWPIFTMVNETLFFLGLALLYDVMSLLRHTLDVYT